MRKPQKHTKRIKTIILCFVLLSTISFTTYMGILAVIRGSKTLNNLKHIRGEISNLRFIKHKQKRKYNISYEDVMVLSIDGTSDEFGFTKSSSTFKSLFNSIRQGKTAEIYYDQEGKRIEENVTLHIFDLKINDFQFIDISDVKKREWVGAVIFFSISFIILVIILSVVKQIRKINHQLSN